MNIKNAIILCMIWFMTSNLQAQRQGTVVNHYIFPEFVTGTVLMKDGTTHQTLLNYNAASEEMIFDQNGQKLAFAEVTLNGLDTVFIEDRRFVLLDNANFAEVIHKDGYTLMVQYKCRVIPPGKPSGYGGTSQTSSVTSYSSLLGGGQLYELELPDDFKVNPYNVYWFQKEEEKESFVSLRQVRRYYSKQRALYNKYLKENEVDFDDSASMRELIYFLETSE